MCALGKGVGFPVHEGGAQSLTTTLVRRLQFFGGRVECDARVTDVIVRAGRAVAVRTRAGDVFDARRAVVADVPASVLYTSLLREDDLPARFRARVSRFQWDNGTVKIDWNLNGPIPWSAEPARREGTVHLAESVD